MNTAELRKLAELILWRLEQMDCNCDRDPELLCHRCKGLVEIQEIIDAEPTPTKVYGPKNDGKAAGQ